MVDKQKRKVKSVILDRFLHAKMPPYADGMEQKSHRDYHDFGSMM